MSGTKRIFTLNDGRIFVDDGVRTDVAQFLGHEETILHLAPDIPGTLHEAELSGVKLTANGYLALAIRYVFSFYVGLGKGSIRWTVSPECGSLKITISRHQSEVVKDALAMYRCSGENTKFGPFMSHDIAERLEWIADNKLADIIAVEDIEQ